MSNYSQNDTGQQVGGAQQVMVEQLSCSKAEGLKLCPLSLTTQHTKGPWGSRAPALKTPGSFCTPTGCWPSLLPSLPPEAYFSLKYQYLSSDCSLPEFSWCITGNDIPCDFS